MNVNNYTNQGGQLTAHNRQSSWGHIDRYWIICQSVTVITAFVIIWISLCLFVFGIKTGKFSKLKSTKKEDFDGGIVHLWALIATASALLRLGATQVFLITHIHGGSYECSVTLHLNTLTYGLANTFLYVFLWFRQRSFYAHPRFSAIFSKWIKASSIFVIWFVLIIGTTLLLLFLCLRHFNFSEQFGCIRSKTHKRPHEINYGVFAWHFISQAILLGLFTYPLVKNVPRSQTHTTVVSESTIEQPTISITSNQTWKTNRRLSVMKKIVKSDNIVMQALRRTTFCTVIFLVGEFSAMITSVYFKVGDGRSNFPVSLSIFNINLIVHCAVVLASFTTWKLILKSPCGNISFHVINKLGEYQSSET